MIDIVQWRASIGRYHSGRYCRGSSIDSIYGGYREKVSSRYYSCKELLMCGDIESNPGPLELTAINAMSILDKCGLDKWNTLLQYLDLPSMDHIQQVSPISDSMKLVLVTALDQWITDQRPSWEVLVSAVEKCGAIDTANNMRRELGITAPAGMLEEAMSIDQSLESSEPVVSTSHQQPSLSAVTGLKNHLDAMCRLADPVTLAVNLHSKDLISDSTKDRALQIIGIENYQKNAEMLNEVEKVIKSDSTKLPILCQVLHTMPLMKQYGEMILKEAGLPVHLTLPSSSTAPSSLQTTTTPLCRYSDIVKKQYIQQPVVQSDWPPPVGQEYYGELALAEMKDRCSDFSSEQKKTWLMLRGKIDECVTTLPARRKVDIVDILRPMKQNEIYIKNLRVIIDGPPGVGKTTLCRKLCNMWAKGDLEHLGYKLMLFCPLRTSKVFSAQTLHNLLSFVYDNYDLPHIVEWVEHNNGEGVVFIFDGWDELSDEHKESSLVSEIISGRKLHDCSVVVTSRTYASASLMDIARVYKHIEVLGFREHEVELCLRKTLTEIEAEALIKELKVRQDVLSLCYIPLVCSILIFVYSKNKLLPDTLTQLYKEFILQTIRRHLKKAGKNPKKVTNFDKLPPDISESFGKLCHFAYEGLCSPSPKMTYSWEQIDETFGEQFGSSFLGLITSFAVFDEELFQFIHLTIQEFLAAWWISKQDNVVELLDRHWENDHFRMPIRFVAGLNGFNGKEYLKYFQHLCNLQCSNSPDVLIGPHCNFGAPIMNYFQHRHHSCNFNFQECHLSNLVFNSKKVDTSYVHLFQLLYESQNEFLCKSVAESIPNSSLCLRGARSRGHDGAEKSAFDYICICFFLAKSAMIWEYLHLENIQCLDEFVKARCIYVSPYEHSITAGFKFDTKLHTTSIVYNKCTYLAELHLDFMIGHYDAYLLLQSATLKIIDIRVNFCSCRSDSINMEDVIIKNKKLTELSIQSNADESILLYNNIISDHELNILSQICNGIAQNTTLQSVSLGTERGIKRRDVRALLAFKKSLATILETNHTIQYLDIDTYTPTDVAVVNTPLKVLYARPGISSWCTKCTQLERLQLYYWEEQPVVVLLTAGHHLQTLELPITDRHNYPEHCTALFESLRCNSTIKNLRTRCYSSSRKANRALKCMLSDNTTLVRFEFHYFEYQFSSQDFIKRVAAGLKNNSTLQEMSLPLMSRNLKESTVDHFSTACKSARLVYLKFEVIKHYDDHSDQHSKFIYEQGLIFFRKILQANSTLKKFIVSNSSHITGSDDIWSKNAESFWRVVLRHPSLDTYIMPMTDILARARDKVMEELGGVAMQN